MMNNPTTTSPQRVKPWRAIATACILAVAIALALLVTLILTIFRPTDPTFTIYLVGLPTLNLADLLRSKNLTRAVVIGVDNRNYASATWTNFTVEVKLSDIIDDDDVVAEVPIPGGTVLQRSSRNVTTFVTVLLDRLEDRAKEVSIALREGGLNFTCSVTALGEIRAFGVLPRVRGSVSVECFGSVWLNKVVSSGVGLFGGKAWCWTVRKKVIM